MEVDAPSWLFEVVMLLAAGALLAVLLLGARRALALAPIRKARRRALSRVVPLLALVAALIYSIFGVRVLFRGQPQWIGAMVAVVVGGFALASWDALRDLLSGAFLRAGRLIELGDQLRVNDLSGRVKRLGYRVMVLETTQGDEAILPLGMVLREKLIRKPALEGVAPHVFTIELCAGSTKERSLVELKRQIRRSALLEHWAATSREPEVAVATSGSIEVTVFTVHPERGPDIEAAVRRTVELKGAR